MKLLIKRLQVELHTATGFERTPHRSVQQLGMHCTRGLPTDSYTALDKELAAREDATFEVVIDDVPKSAVGVAVRLAPPAK